MKVELVAQDNETGKLYDISEVASNVSLVSQLGEQPSKLTLEYISSDKMKLHEGSPISFKVDGTGIFFGTIFSTELSDNGRKYSITAYDQLYYLKNKDTIVFGAMTAASRFEKLCKIAQVKYRIDDNPNFIVPASIEDNQTYYSMIQNALDRTLIGTGNWYIIRDDFGTLQFTSLNRLKTMLYIGNKSGITGYTFKSSIESDTYNQVKLIKDNKETGKREVYIVQDTNNISKWGLLQYFEKVDENANPAQIKETANLILKLKNREVKTLKVECLGDTRVFAGVGVVLGIKDLEEWGIAPNKYFMVNSCTHKFTNNVHTMSLEMVVSI